MVRLREGKGAYICDCACCKACPRCQNSLKGVSEIKSLENFWLKFAQKYGTGLGYGSEFTQFYPFFAYDLQNLWTFGDHIPA